LIRRGGTSIALAIRYWVMPIGLRNSVIRISPGWVGAKSAIGLPFLVVVDELDVGCSAGGPGEADTPLVVHSDAVLTGTIAG
jgi:hypothetical protein